MFAILQLMVIVDKYSRGIFHWGLVAGLFHVCHFIALHCPKPIWAKNGRTDNRISSSIPNLSTFYLPANNNSPAPQ